MTTYLTVQQAIESRMEAEWNDPKAKVFFENVPRKRSPVVPYVKFFIRNGRAEEKGYGDGTILYRRPGIIICQCFTAIGNGLFEARALAQRVLDVFEGKTFDPVVCREGEVIEVGEDPKDNTLFLVNAKVYFDWDYSRAPS
ncbi:hypothetical protein KAR91_14210 [Candidatus Pacearchaeota archaeon]|nr:hypothetical protein [Candidatus Pacearchaeota archaeon]